MGKKLERLSYGGETASDRRAFEGYLNDLQRGKSALQLLAVKKAVTPEIRRSWSPRTFSGVHIPVGIFDEVICNISYHFNKPGAKYGSVAVMTQTAQEYFRNNRHATVLSDGLLKLPGGIFELDGRIVTFF